MKNEITNIETMNETENPIVKTLSSIGLNPIPLCLKYERISNKLAPVIVGIAKKNENSAPKFLEQPNNKAPNMVAPDLEVPGTKASVWKIPIKKDVLYDNLFILLIS